MSRSDQDFNVSAIEIEGNQYELIEREGNGIGLAVTGGYGFATRGGEADEIEFGPIVEFGSGPLLLVTHQSHILRGSGRQIMRTLMVSASTMAGAPNTRSPERWGLGVEMFGEIEDLSNSGSFDDQNHSIGPTLFYNPGEDDDDVGGEGDDEDEIAGPPEMEFSFNVGVQFGLTDMTSDTALKFQGSLAF
ncbi:MAG: hypothetical protein R3D30_04450 [Hyphomicrobiales bacterium]